MLSLASLVCQTQRQELRVGSGDFAHSELILCDKILSRPIRFDYVIGIVSLLIPEPGPFKILLLSSRLSVVVRFDFEDSYMIRSSVGTELEIYVLL